MTDFNSTAFTNPNTFFLMGIPGLEDLRIWISIPFCSMYIIALMRNILILFIIKTETVLHEPMFCFLSMLAITDLILSTSTLPKMLGVFWFNDHEISFHACLTQMFFIHAFSGAMALNWYVAICNPLRHTFILTNSVVAQVGIVALLCGLVLMTPHPFLVRRWPYCQSNVVPHTHCEHMAVVKLVYVDISINSLYSLVVIILTVGTDVTCISLSYAQILRTVFNFPSNDDRLKTLSTVGPMCVSSSPSTSLLAFLTHHFSQHIPRHTHILLANMYLLAPPMLNPMIYGVRTRQSQECVQQLFMPNISCELWILLLYLFPSSCNVLVCISWILASARSNIRVLILTYYFH